MSKRYHAELSATVRIRAALFELGKAALWQRLGQLSESRKCLKAAFRDIERAEQFMRIAGCP